MIGRSVAPFKMVELGAGADYLTGGVPIGKRKLRTRITQRHLGEHKPIVVKPSRSVKRPAGRLRRRRR